MPHRTQRWLAAGKISLAVPILAVCPFVAGSEAAVWVPDHVVIVIEENLSYRSLVPELTYLGELTRDHANFINSHGIDHPSQPNYLALFPGSTQGRHLRRMYRSPQRPSHD
jgi:phosphatidylinositol-3-phosphatase